MPEAFGAARAEQAAASPLRTPDLVWRNRAGEPPAVADVPAERAFAQSGGDLARAAPPPAASPEGNAGPQQRMLDAALMDRLAEDVIGRVEKRIRIERERRGI
jgi:hypothetical protein